MLSRVAESMYWMNRYLERVQNYARFIEVNLNMYLELTPDFEEQWLPLIQTAGDEAIYKATYTDYSRENVVRFLTFDTLNPSSITSSLSAARENARSIREGISGEMWEAINTLYLRVREGHRQSQWSIEELFEFFKEIKQGCYLIEGIAHNTISHTERWHFARLGQFLERADKLSRILDVHSYYALPKEKSKQSTFELIQWVAILRSTSSYEMFLQEFGEPRWNRIVEFLMLNPYFPRSLRYCLQKSQHSLHCITGNDIGSFQVPIEKTLGRMKVNLDYIEVDEIIGFGVHDYLDRVQVRLNEVGNMVCETFFDPNANLEPVTSAVYGFNT
ncbi:alpha-E domain-containing protein [bacterium]|nr:alpha-E domain-containing protein [bacterium]